MAFKNPDDKKRYIQQYRLANKERLDAYMKQYNQANKEKLTEYRKQYFQANKQLIADKQKIHDQANKEQVTAYNKKYYQANKERRSSYIKHYTYGLTAEQYTTLVSEQNNQCAICSKTFKSTKETHIDHCHTTGVVRGLLCTDCNLGLGRFKDNYELLVKAHDYLVRYQISTDQEVNNP